MIQAIAEIPSGTDLLIDANILIYAALRHSAECHQLVQRCIDEDVFGYTTMEIISEVCHRLMLAEAVAKKLISKPYAGSLKDHAHLVPSLQDYWVHVRRIQLSNIAIMPLDEERFTKAHEVRQRQPLLTTDSLLLAAAYQLGIEDLASNDSDFDESPGVNIYRATDV